MIDTYAVFDLHGSIMNLSINDLFHVYLCYIMQVLGGPLHSSVAPQ